jgi:hypothetical protein
MESPPLPGRLPPLIRVLVGHRAADRRFCRYLSAGFVTAFRGASPADSNTSPRTVLQSPSGDGGCDVELQPDVAQQPGWVETPLRADGHAREGRRNGPTGRPVLGSAPRGERGRLRRERRQTGRKRSVVLLRGRVPRHRRILSPRRVSEHHRPHAVVDSLPRARAHRGRRWSGLSLRGTGRPDHPPHGRGARPEASPALARPHSASSRPTVPGPTPEGRRPLHPGSLRSDRAEPAPSSTDVDRPAPGCVTRRGRVRARVPAAIAVSRRPFEPPRGDRPNRRGPTPTTRSAADGRDGDLGGCPIVRPGPDGSSADPGRRGTEPRSPRTTDGPAGSPDRARRTAG